MKCKITLLTYFLGENPFLLLFLVSIGKFSINGLGLGIVAAAIIVEGVPPGL